MENEFIPYEQALALKELGFDEKCFGYYNHNKYNQDTSNFDTIIFKYKCKLINRSYNLYPDDKIKRDEYKLEKDKSNYFCKAPLYQQAFRWFREKYNIFHQGYSFNKGDFHFRIYKMKNNNDKIIFSTIVDLNIYPKSYEEVELECLKKLIEIVKQNKNG